MPEHLPRIRLAAVSSDTLLIVRGDALDPETLRADARRFLRRYPDWGRYGVSAFSARESAEVDVLCETQLVLFATVVVFRRDDLLAAGLEVVPTFRAPHVTVAHGELTLLVEQLTACEHETVANRFSRPGGSSA